MKVEILTLPSHSVFLILIVFEAARAMEIGAVSILAATGREKQKQLRQRKPDQLRRSMRRTCGRFGSDTAFFTAPESVLAARERREWVVLNGGTRMKPDASNQKLTRSFLGTLNAVAWSFVGLRRREDFEQDVGGLNPVYVIMAGLLGTALFVGILVTVVHIMVG